MAAPPPYAPGSVEAAFAPPRRRRGGVVGPLLLILVGGVFLLQNLGVLPPNAWTNLWRLWPLVLVLVGIELLFGSRLHWALLTLIVACLFVVGALATGRLGSTGEAQVRSFEQVLDGASSAAVVIRFGAGQLTAGPLADTLATTAVGAMRFEGASELMPESRYAVTNGVGRLEYTVGGRGGPFFAPFSGQTRAPRMDVLLSPAIPMTLTVQTGAADANLDLTRLRVTSLDLSTGAASTTLRLPQAAGTTTAHISGGAATINVEVPPQVAVQIRHRGGLSALTVDETRFPRVGDQMYRSPGYETAANKVDLSLETGVATVRVS